MGLDMISSKNLLNLDINENVGFNMSLDLEISIDFDISLDSNKMSLDSKMNPEINTSLGFNMDIDLGRSPHSSRGLYTKTESRFLTRV